ncbi:MAG: hypothetical protein DRH24_04205 [Deltaproteobacteria bacterium]|nr:MAG: hypothetical protein DRH24_04205 [Deltaproteobacteria bacterium]
MKMSKDFTHDIIREVVNIGIGDAASALSSLINSRVTIKVPEIHILDTRDAPDFIQKEIRTLGVYIAQDFKGVFQGKTLLFYTKESCISLLKCIMEDISVTSAMTETAIATLQEIGNIIMVSCVSTISNMLGDTVEFQIPDVTLEISEGYFKNIVKGFGELDKTIVVRNQMVVSDKEIEGYFFILLSFDNFISLIEKLAAKVEKR